MFDDDVPDGCEAEKAPACCDLHGYSHLCSRIDEHDGPHECVCGHRWTEPDQ